MTSNTIQALKNLYVASGGSLADVKNLNVIPDLINRISAINSINNLSVEGADPSVDLWGVSSSQIQERITYFGNGVIFGYLKDIDEPLWPSGTLSGTGIFIALKFIANFKYDSIKVVLDPSSTNMQPQELDEDMIAVFKLIKPEQYHPIEQKIKAIVTIDGIEYIKYFDLSMVNS